MALQFHAPSTLSYSKGSFIHCRRSLPQKPLSHQCMIPIIKGCLASTQICEEPTRRSANYPRTIWSYDFVQSLNSDYKGEVHKITSKKLKEEVKHRLDDGAMGQLGLLELIDDIQRLGLGYQFKEEIKKALDTIVCMKDLETMTKESLHATALRFRLLRQHGYEVKEDMFNRFKDEAGNFKASYLKDTKGILSLFEASHLAVEGEHILEEARHFARTALKEINGNIESNLAKQVNHALELPLHRRMPRLYARWYIDVYEENKNSIPALTELAKLDFNMVQAVHQEDLANLSRWWKYLGLGDHLSFARDSLVQCFFWTLGWNPEPQLSKFRIEMCKVNILITVIDDVYDVYGTLEELELFTDAVERWDIKAMEQLPEYMKICFLALFNTVNELAYFHLTEHGFDSLPFLKKEWTSMCKAYLQEAKWYYSGHKTTFEEYLNNAFKSIAGNVLLIHCFFSMQHSNQKDDFDCISQCQSLFHWPSVVLRLVDDLATSRAELERGDVLKSVESYMRQTGASEEVAREYISNMVDEAWKKMNTDIFTNDFPLPQPYTETTVNLARVSQLIYQYGDGHGIIDDETTNRAKLLLFEPIPLLTDA